MNLTPTVGGGIILALLQETKRCLTEAKWVGRAQGVLGVTALVLAAQFWPGWQLDNAADKKIAAAYRSGYVLAQGSVCAELFMAQPNAQEKVAELEATNGAYAQVQLIPEAFRTLPGEVRVPGFPRRTKRPLLDEHRSPFGACSTGGNAPFPDTGRYELAKVKTD